MGKLKLIIGIGAVIAAVALIVKANNKAKEYAEEDFDEEDEDFSCSCPDCCSCACETDEDDFSPEDFDKETIAKKSEETNVNIPVVDEDEDKNEASDEEQPEEKDVSEGQELVGEAKEETAAPVGDLEKEDKKTADNSNVPEDF